MFLKQLDDVRQLLVRQRRVSGLVHHQSMPRHELVEGLVRRQHLAELRNALHRMSEPDIARLLEALAGDDRAAAWRQVDEQLCERVLELVPDDLRDELVAARPMPSDGNMLNAFELRGTQWAQVRVETRADLQRIRPVWVDLVAPSANVRAWVGDHFGIPLPDPDHLKDIEASARFFVDDNGDAHLHSDFLLDVDGASRNVAVAFILHRDVLFSIRTEELPVFRLQRLRVRTQTSCIADGKEMLLDLYAADVEYSAGGLENIYADFEAVGRRVLDHGASDEEAGHILAEIARGEDLNGRIRRNVMDTRRALSFLLRGKLLSSAQREDARQILRDIESLDVHTGFLFGKINFLMDSTIGFINIKQNRRISKLTAFGVVFTPINIVAGIGGMSEFSMMTSGIPWPWAYGGFVTVILLFGLALYGGLRHVERRQGRMLRDARARRNGDQDLALARAESRRWKYGDHVKA